MVNIAANVAGQTQAAERIQRLSQNLRLKPPPLQDVCYAPPYTDSNDKNEQVHGIDAKYDA